MDKKICIVGGSGFIGSSILSRIRERKKNVLIVGRSPLPLNTIPKNVEYLFGDIKDEKFSHNVLKKTDEIIYLAYSSTPRTSLENPYKDLNDNLISAVIFFEIASQYPIKKIIYISSGGAVYGESDGSRILESHPTNPISPYGITKLAIEKYANFFWKTKKLPVVTIRPSNIYGELQKPFIGQGFISTAIASILINKEIIIYGHKGTYRDYLYIDDFVESLIIALDKCMPGEIYNVGTGIGFSNLDIVSRLRDNRKLKNKPFKISHEAYRASDVQNNILDSNKFRYLCNWQPNVSIDEGIDKVVNHYMKNTKS